MMLIIMKLARSTMYLVPTGLDDSLPLEPVAKELLLEAAASETAMLLVEELKIARRRWLAWGLPRAAIDRFVEFNEHTQDQVAHEVLRDLRAGKSAILMSDSGLPAFCDPGQKLVSLCHDAGIRVTATPFPNSIALTVALSGFPHDEFHFAGFLPADQSGRKRKLEDLAKYRCPIVMMDTPYRLQALLKDVADSQLGSRVAFLAINLNQAEERLIRGKLKGTGGVLEKLGTLNKVEFVLMLSGGI
jgi:16S rRNA (cytidine1402-2'-O)-methyltransferase